MKLTQLREVRELHGWSQSKLAEESGVSRDGISNYETGRREAWPATAKKLADALQAEISDLVARVEEPALAGKAEAPTSGPSQGITTGPKAGPLSGPDAQAWLRERAQERRRLYVPVGELARSWEGMDAFVLDEEGRIIEGERDELAKEIDAFIRRLRADGDRKDSRTYLNALSRALKQDLQRRYRHRRRSQIVGALALVEAAGERLSQAAARQIRAELEQAERAGVA